MDTKRRNILTVGHSNHTLEVFFGLLVRHCVTALADVRSSPYSRVNPQFNRERFAETLNTSGIKYVYLGGELGGRSDDRSCYENGRIRYDRIARTPRFLDGLTRIVHGAERYRVALMCAEKEPVHCHRTLLVGHALDMRGVDVAHILYDGTLETHASAMNRLLTAFSLDADMDLFYRQRSRKELIAEAIARQAECVGHTIEHVNNRAERKDE